MEKRIDEEKKLQLRYLLLLILLMIGVAFFDFFCYAPYCIIESGEYPITGICGLIISISSLFCVLFLEKIVRFSKVWLLGIFLIGSILIPTLYCETFNGYANHLNHLYLKDSNVRIGKVYEKRIPLRRGAHCVEIKVGIDKIHTRVYRIDEYSELASSIYVGKQVILRVSDEYPRVNEVLEWNPTYDEIEKHKVPRKFKSYISGKIVEEEE